MEFLDSNFDKYQKIILDSLTLKEFSPAVTKRDSCAVVTFKAKAPAVYAIEII